MHLLSIAGRLGIDLKLEQFDRLSMTTPVLLKLKPSGEYYMNDFFNAGGVAASLNALGPQMHREVITVTVRTFGGEIAAAKIDDPRLIGTMEKPVSGPRGISVLFGNIAPNGAIIRTGLASPNHLVHRGRAAVFDGKAELDAKLNDPDFDVRPGDVIVLRGDGPKSSGMPESGPIPMPGKLLKQGITDMVRITGSRLGGTVKQTAVLHVAPESTVGGPLGLVQTGAMIRLDVPNRRRQVVVTDGVLAARHKLADPPVQKRAPSRGCAKLVVQSVTQANRDAISIS